MQSKIIIISNKLGLHARASSRVVQLANSFRASIFIEKDGRKANAKSIMSLMMLAASVGSEILITAEGVDEVEACEKISELFNSKFDEIE